MTGQAIVEWVTKKSGPAAKSLELGEEAKVFSESAPVVVVGLFDDVESKDAKVCVRVCLCEVE
jgi:protein disulfide-isomerase A1